MSITLYIGPMFSGKSSSIINELEKYNLAQIKTLMVKYINDIRYSDKNEIITHNMRTYSQNNSSIMIETLIRPINYTY